MFCDIVFADIKILNYWEKIMAEQNKTPDSSEGLQHEKPLPLGNTETFAQGAQGLLADPRAETLPKDQLHKFRVRAAKAGTPRPASSDNV